MRADDLDRNTSGNYCKFMVYWNYLVIIVIFYIYGYTKDGIYIRRGRKTMFKRKKLLILLVALVITTGLVPLFATYADRDIVVYIDGQQINFSDQQPVIVRNRVLVPVRGTFESMGFEVEWSSRTRMGRLVKGETIIIIPADVDVFVINDEIITSDVPQQIINGRMMLPLRAVAEAVGATANWSNTTRVANITSMQTGLATDNVLPQTIVEIYESSE